MNAAWAEKYKMNPACPDSIRRKAARSDNHEFCGIVLAGGKSRRMGTDKSELTLNGRTFLEIQIQKLQLLGAADIIISGRTSPLPGTRSVMDQHPGLGPLGGLCSTFPSITQRCALVLSVDTPLISVSTLKSMLETHFRGSSDATLLDHEGMVEPLTAVYNTDTVNLLKELTENGKLAMKAYIDRLHYQLFNFEGGPEELLNCNSPQDFSMLLSKNRSTTVF